MRRDAKMRILGFQKRWDKLRKSWEFITFRYPRRDKDWEVGEVVKVVVKPRSKNKEVLGVAKIIGKEARAMPLPNEQFDYYACPPLVTEQEAIADGFKSRDDMCEWLTQTYGHDDRWVFNEPMNKLTLRWIRIDNP
jgi:hypothetical protein